MLESLVHNFFDKEMHILDSEKLQIYLRPGLKLKTKNCVL